MSAVAANSSCLAPCSQPGNQLKMLPFRQFSGCALLKTVVNGEHQYRQRRKDHKQDNAGASAEIIQDRSYK
jgi:hypothetical protein